MKRIVIGVSGASGALIPLKLLERLAKTENVETHLVISDAAQQTLRHELGPNGYSLLHRLAKRSYAVEDVGAAIASGSVPTAGMIVAPCSMRTLAAIATGYSDSLLTRAADVHLKERRKLVLIARETPLHLVHLRNMCTVTEMGPSSCRQCQHSTSNRNRSKMWQVRSRPALSISSVSACRRRKAGTRKKNPAGRRDDRRFIRRLPGNALGQSQRQTSP